MPYGLGTLGNIGYQMGLQQPFNQPQPLGQPQTQPAWMGGIPQAPGGMVPSSWPGLGQVPASWNQITNQPQQAPMMGGIQPQAQIPGGGGNSLAQQDWAGWTDPQRAAFMNTAAGTPGLVGAMGLTPQQINQYGAGGTTASNYGMNDVQSIAPQIAALKAQMPMTPADHALNARKGMGLGAGMQPQMGQPQPFGGRMPMQQPQQTLGGLGQGGAMGQGMAQMGGSGGMPQVPSNIPNANAPNYGLNVGAYLNPGQQFATDWANRGLQSAYAGQGDLLSGAAMRGITDYNQNMALNNYYNPALQTAQQQQGFGYGVNAADRNFAFQQQLANQTIPFQQQMQLAGLGLQGTQSQQAVQNLLAQLLSQNTIAAGQAQGTGTIGGSNAISNMIQQMLANYMGQNIINRIPGLNQNPTG